MVLEGTWQKAGGQSGFKLQLSLVFFPVVVSELLGMIRCNKN